MYRFIDGEDRMQPALPPHCIEDYVDEENPVQVIEVLVNGLDLAALGFSGMTPAARGPGRDDPDGTRGLRQGAQRDG
jgi:hypothetical protein